MMRAVVTVEFQHDEQGEATRTAGGGASFHLVAGCTEGARDAAIDSLSDFVRSFLLREADGPPAPPAHALDAAERVFGSRR